MNPRRTDAGKPPGLIEFLEEIIGSDEFVEKIEAAKERINSIERAQDVQVQRVKAMEELMNQRAAKKDAVVNHVLKVHEHKTLRIKRYIVEVFRSNDRYEASKAKLKEAKEKLAKVREEQKE